jgi:hypothetical protein
VVGKVKILTIVPRSNTAVKKIGFGGRKGTFRLKEP